MKANEPDKIWVTVSETVNLGNYQSVKVEAGFSKAYTKEDPELLIINAIDELKTVVERKANKIRKQRK